MNTLRSLWIALVACIVGVGAGSPAFAGDLEKDAEALTAHMETLSALVNDNAGDCDAMAVALDGYASEHADEIAALTVRLESVSEGDEAVLLEAYGARLEKVGQSLVGGLTACASHEGVMTAFTQLEATSRAKKAEVAGADPASDADVKKLVGHFESLGNLMKAAGGDCAKLAKSVDGFVDDHGDELESLALKLDALPAERRAEIEAVYQERMTTAIQNMMESAMVCSGDADVDAAMKRLAF